MWNIGALLYDACKVSAEIVKELAVLDHHLHTALPPGGDLLSGARCLDTRLQGFLAEVQRFSSTAIEVSDGLEPKLDHLWDGLVAASACGIAGWDDETLLAWQRAVERLEELALILGVVAEQAPRMCSLPPMTKEKQHGQGNQAIV